MFLKVMNMSLLSTDVLGVAKSTGELEKFQARSGRELQKKEIQLVDRSNSSVRIVGVAIIDNNQPEHFIKFYFNLDHLNTMGFTSRKL